MQTCKGKESLGYKGFRYRYQRLEQKGARISWRCTNKNCNGSNSTDNNHLDPLIKSEHNHLPDVAHVKLAKMISVLKKRAEKESAPIPNLYREESMKLSAVTNHTVAAPTYVSIHSSLYRHRHSRYPKLPPSAENVEIPINLQKKLHVEKIFFYIKTINTNLLFSEL